MRLRPHHLLCVQKFVGHGYDEKFVRHLAGVVARLAAQPETRITLTQGCDDVCAHCPNRVKSRCVSMEKVDRMDSCVLEICGLGAGESGTWAALAQRAKERILGAGAFEVVCAGCQWFALCRGIVH